VTAIVTMGDARDLLLPDESVDLIVTSPPYYSLRSYIDDGKHYATQIGSEPTPEEYIANLIMCTREMIRVLKPSGSIFVNLGDKYSFQKSLLFLPERYRIACTDQLGLTARAMIVWHKTNGLPDAARDRAGRSHEDWIHLTQGVDYFSALDELREPYSNKTIRTHPTVYGAGNHGQGSQTLRLANHPLGKLPGSVWPIPTQQLRVPPGLGVRHFAAFPMEWPRRLIVGWCPADGVVLDPFGGTGTTALVADVLGRVGINVDASADYCRIALWRTQDEKQRARVVPQMKEELA